MSNREWRDQARRSWEKLLNADALRFNLKIGSVFLTAYEMLLQSLVDQLRGFYGVSWTAEETEVGPDYKARVLDRHSMPYFASADWFVENGALTPDDVDVLRSIREHRNFVAHNIPRIVMDASVDVDLSLLGEIVRLVSALDRWSVLEIEIPTDPDWDGEEDPQDVWSMRMVTLQILISFAAGDEEALNTWRTALDEAWPQGDQESEEDAG